MRNEEWQWDAVNQQKDDGILGVMECCQLLHLAMSVDKSKVPRQDLRVLKTNMVYCSGIPSTLTLDELTSQSYFGQYGKIDKVIVNPYPNKNYCSLYITYSHQFEAATAILSCNEYQIGRSTLWCLFGTMKYCRFFLKKIECKNLPNCPYLHVLDRKNEIEINNSPSQAFPEHELMAKNIYKKYPDRIKLIEKENKPDRELPSPVESLYHFEDSTPQKPPQSPPKQEPQPAIQPVQQKKEKCIDSMMKSMILKQLEKSKGSRVIQAANKQEKSIKQIMISGLLD